MSDVYLTTDEKIEMTAGSDVREVLYVHDASQLDALCRALVGSKWLAIDTEFLREKTYYPKLCLLQIANESLIACVDPLAVDDLTPLFRLLYDTSITKILHSARQDYEIFFNLMGRLPEPVFDTQIAASLCMGSEQISYAALVKQVVGVELEKGCTRTNWSRRPLAVEQLKYAEDDVRYLGDIYHYQVALLCKQGVLSWLNEECGLLVRSDTYQVEPSQAWLRVKEARRMKPAQLIVLQGLAAWREMQAIEENKPRKWIIRDETLVELAVKCPLTEDALSKVKGLSEGFLSRHAKVLLSLIAKAKETPEARWPRLPLRQKRSAEEASMMAAMMALMSECAAAHGVVASVLGGKRDIEALLNGETNNRILNGWRYDAFGKTLQAVLRGEITLTHLNGRLRIERVE